MVSQKSIQRRNKLQIDQLQAHILTVCSALPVSIWGSISGKFKFTHQLVLPSLVFMLSSLTAHQESSRLPTLSIINSFCSRDRKLGARCNSRKRILSHFHVLGVQRCTCNQLHSHPILMCSECSCEFVASVTLTLFSCALSAAVHL